MIRAGLKYGSEHVSCEQSHGASGSEKQCESLLLMTADLLFTWIDLSAVLTANHLYFFLTLILLFCDISENHFWASVISVRWGPQKTPTQPRSLFRFRSTSRLQSSFIPQTVRLYDRLFMMMMMPWRLKLFTCCTSVPQQQPLKVVRLWKKNTQLLITEWVCWRQAQGVSEVGFG